MITDGTRARIVGGDGQAVDVHVVGDGDPVTVYAHAWGESGVAMRPLAAGVPGTRLFVDFVHDGAAWRYEQHAAALRTVLEYSSADRVVGQSMGAGVVLRLLREAPGAVRTAALLLPPAPHRPMRPEVWALFVELHDARAARDTQRLVAAISACFAADTLGLPETLDYIAARAARMLRIEAAPHQLADFPWRGLAPAPLDGIRALVIGQAGDRIHDAEDARYVAALLPDAEQHVYPATDPTWRLLPDLRNRVATFLSA